MASDPAKHLLHLMTGASAIAVAAELQLADHLAMCNVGGRERTLDQYRTLLTDAGFTLTTTHDLPLDFTLLDFKLP